MSWTIVLVAHGTVEDLNDMQHFLLEIRRGRPVPPGLLDAMCARYRYVGGSPLLQHTREQASLLARKLDLPTRVAMRLWDPRIGDVCEDLGPADRICLVPLAPFSVEVYRAAAERELRKLPEAPKMVCVDPWGSEPALVTAYAEEVRRHLGDPTAGRPAPEEAVLLTAHSLPQAVIDRGDRYQIEFEACVDRVRDRLGFECAVAYQSQGEGGGQWLGPTLLEKLQEMNKQGVRRVVLSPIGFLSEHIETLYDLDVEARLYCEALEMELVRVPAIGTHPGFIQAMADAVQKTIHAVD